ncbi:MAG: ComEC/Rec2 family competence protein [Solidesulfovibrio sp. DCME]|uniref:ComEC/Rec2 family competence protein n=1 Tax=Solidesulfovibrio sp. DCME TaxID=3447380 RepID=UPI003D0FC394
MGPPPEKTPAGSARTTVPPLLPWQPCLIAYAAGIAAVAFPWLGLCALGLLALFPRPARGRPRLWHFGLAFGLGLAAGALAMPALPRDAPPCLAQRKPVDLVGEVAAVEGRPGGRLAVTLEGVVATGGDCPGTPLPGRLALAIDQPAFRPVPGETLAVTARLRTTGGFDNPGGADFVFLRRLEGIFYRAYARGDRGQVRRLAPGGNALALRREALLRAVEAALAPPGDADSVSRAALAAPAGDDSLSPAARAMTVALVFGDLSGFSPDDLDVLRRASLSHTLALSGMNVSYVVAVAAALAWAIGRLRPGLFLRLPRPYLTLALAAPLVAGYCWLGGYSPSLYRAACMFGCCAVLLFSGRQAPLLDGLFLALGIMLAAMPLAVFDARLQLSALAVAGIGLFWAPFAAFCRRLPGPWPLRWPLVGLLGVLWTSLCAEAAVLPVVCRLFGDLNFNPWINVLWLPPLGLVVTPLALVGAVLVPVPGLSSLGGLALWAAAWGCEGLMRGLAFLDAHQMLVTTAVLRPRWPEALGCLGLFAALAVTLAGGRRPVAAMGCCLALLVGPGLWRAVSDLRAGPSLTVLDVGQGQSVVLALPGGRRYVIDAGGLYGDFDVGRAVVGAFLADGAPPRLEAALASHPHADHVKGFVSLLARFDVGAFYDNGGRPEGALAAPMARSLADRAIPRAALAAGDRLELGDGYALEVLHPGPGDDRSGNNGSLILRLTRGGVGLAVIPGDAERGVLSRLAASGAQLSATVLILPHHGSVTGFSRRFLAAVSPKVAIASCGDTWAFPASKVEAFLARQGCPVLATNRDGAVTVNLAASGDMPSVARQAAPTGGDAVKKPFATPPVPR